MSNAEHPPNRPPLVLALTGPVGSGVSTVARVLERDGFHRVSLSAPIKAELRHREGFEDPENLSTHVLRKALQDLGNEKRRNKREYWIEKAFEGVPDDKDLVIDCVRNVGEVDWLRHRYANCYLAAIVASPGVRWERLKSEYDKNLQAFEQDDQRDTDEDLPHGQQVDKCVQEADYVLWNEDDLSYSGSREALLSKRLQIDIRMMKGESTRYPSEMETYMAGAYSASYASRCLKRFVGAAIVKDYPLSFGFNENPLGMDSCEVKWGTCFKDDVMHAKLEEMKELYCPKCGAKQEVKKPWRCTNCNDNLKLKLFPSRNLELCTAIHAEERAIRSLGDRSARGATMYVTTFPCLQCARYIVDAGISRVVYVEAYPVKESKSYLELNNVVTVPFEGFKARAFRIFKQRT